jgi:hypothetical protein
MIAVGRTCKSTRNSRNGGMGIKSERNHLTTGKTHERMETILEKHFRKFAVRNNFKRLKMNVG